MSSLSLTKATTIFFPGLFRTVVATFLSLALTVGGEQTSKIPASQRKPGDTWNQCPSANRVDIAAVAAAGSRLVAVGPKGTVVTSGDNGKTWKNRISGIDWYPLSIVTMAKRLVAVGYSNEIVHQLEKLTLRSDALSQNGSMSSLLANMGTVVSIIGLLEKGGMVVISDDWGKTWTVRKLRLPGLHNIFAFGNRLVAVGYKGAILISDDRGDTWAVRKSQPSSSGPISGGIDSLLGSLVFTAVVHSLFDVTAVGNRLVAVGYGGRIVTSDDRGETWVVRESGVSAFGFISSLPRSIDLSLFNVETVGNRLVAVGYGGRVITSDDRGKTWVTRQTGDDFSPPITSGSFSSITQRWEYSLLNVTVTSGRMVAVGPSGRILTSDNHGQSWVSRPSGTSSGLWSVTATDELLVAVGNRGTILRSE